MAKTKPLIITLVVVLVLTVVAIGAEVFARSYATSKVQQQLQAAGVADPQIELHTTSIIFDYLRGKVKRVDLASDLVSTDFEGEKIKLKDLNVRINDLKLQDPIKAGVITGKALLPNSELQKIAQARLPDFQANLEGQNLVIAREFGVVKISATLKVTPTNAGDHWQLRISPEAVRGSILGYGLGMKDLSELATFEVDLPATIHGMQISQIDKTDAGYAITLAGTNVELER